MKDRPLGRSFLIVFFNSYQKTQQGLAVEGDKRVEIVSLSVYRDVCRDQNKRDDPTGNIPPKIEDSCQEKYKHTHIFESVSQFVTGLGKV